MVGLTFKLDKDRVEKSNLGWPVIHVIERTLYVVEHRKVDKKRARERSPHENPADTVLEDDFDSELVEGIYKVDPSQPIGGGAR